MIGLGTAAGLPPAPAASSAEARLAAFCSPAAPEVFDSIVYQHQIWTPDPFDVPAVHDDARAAFERQLAWAATDPPPPNGRILLLHGEAGSGKTHLMRAFRHLTHAHPSAGYFGYLQMTTAAGNYGRYLLHNLLDSLDQPYLPPDVQTSGLMRLSTGVLEAVPDLRDDELDAFRDGSAAGDPADLVFQYADRAVADPRLADCDLDVIRVLLHLQRPEPWVRHRTAAWLRCEDLPPADRVALGGLLPRTREEHPLQMVRSLARLMSRLYAAPLVVCVDQLENVATQDGPAVRFRRVADTLVALTNLVPSSLCVIACLADFYTEYRQHLARPVIDRLERNPEPVRLSLGRELREVVDMVAVRLGQLYDRSGVEPDPADPTFPFAPEHLRPLVGLRTRDVLEACRTHHERCIGDGAWSPPAWAEGPIVIDDADVEVPAANEVLEQAWNEFRATFGGKVPDDEAGTAAVLAAAVAACGPELPGGHAFTATVDGRMVDVSGPPRDGDGGGGGGGGGPRDGKLLVAVSDRAAQGNGLSRQVQEAERRAAGRPLVLVRSTAFPANPGLAVSRQIAKVVAAGGRKAVVENADWRTMLAFAAFAAFRQAKAADPDFAAWQKVSRPLTQLPSLRQILDLDNLPTSPAGKREPAAAAAPPAAVPPAAMPPAAMPPTAVPPAAAKAAPSARAPAPVPPAAVTPPSAAPPAATPVPTPSSVPATVPPPAMATPAPPVGPLLLGHAKGLAAGPVTVDPAELKQHAAFLGGPGSGKTTAALSLIEQLLLRGVPAILVDRKGDLSRYADPAAYVASAADEGLFDGAYAERLAAFRAGVDVRLYTPGSADGRPLAIPVVPEGLGQMSAADRAQTALFAAAALGGMMGYRPNRQADQIAQAILAKAIEVLAAAAPAKPTTVDALQALVQDMDAALLNAVGGYEPRHYRRLGENLLTLKLQHGRLLAAGGDPLDVDALLGRPPEAGAAGGGGTGGGAGGDRAGVAPSAGRARLTIVNTQFLGSAAAADFWVAQFLMALDRWRGRRPSADLQAVVLLDEADQYLPAVGRPATKAPLESLLRRARSAGLGLLLSTQSPGDFDYRCRENVRAWVVGRVREPVALDKLKPMFADARLDPAARLPGQETGEFHLLREGKVVALKAERSLVETRQVPEQRVLELARGGGR